jgi:hypothetical protein
LDGAILGEVLGLSDGDVDGTLEGRIVRKGDGNGDGGLDGEVLGLSDGDVRVRVNAGEALVEFHHQKT